MSVVYDYCELVGVFGSYIFITDSFYLCVLSTAR